GGALEFRRGDVSEWGEHGCHGVVHPDIDWTELALDGIGSLLNLLTLSHIRGNRQRAASAVVYIRNRAVQSILSSRQQADTRPTLGECARGCASHASRCACNDHDLCRPFFCVHVAPPFRQVTGLFRVFSAWGRSLWPEIRPITQLVR